MSEYNQNLFVSKKFIKLFGLKPAVYLSLFLNNREDYRNEDKFINIDGKYYLICDDMDAQQIGLSNYKIRQYKRKFSDLGIFDLKKKGIPAKEYYLINYDVLNSFEVK